MMLITFTCFYRACKAQGLDPQSLPYAVPWAPYTACVALTLGICALVFVGYGSFFPWNTMRCITAYFGSIFAIVQFLSWKITKRTQFVKPEEAGLISEKKAVDEECSQWEGPAF
jgi:amino acid transporter